MHLQIIPKSLSLNVATIPGLGPRGKHVFSARENLSETCFWALWIEDTRVGLSLNFMFFNKSGGGSEEHALAHALGKEQTSLLSKPLRCTCRVLASAFYVRAFRRMFIKCFLLMVLVTLINGLSSI